MRSLFSDRWFLGGMLLFLAIATGFQIGGGAYTAEFTGHPDEAAHFISSLLVRDYLSLWPPPDPMPWAVQYYIHYPKVAIGHWPPGYYILQAFWWLFFPAGRASALWLNLAMAALTMGLYYVLARRIRPGWPVLFTGAVLLLTPVFQEANAMVMADLPSLLAGIAVLYAVTRALENPGGVRLGLIAVALAAAMAVKGTGAALLAAPLVLLVRGGEGKPLRHTRLAWIGAAGMAAVFLLYLVQYRGSLSAMMTWGGLSFQLPWRIDQLPGLAGPVCLALAAAGAGLAFFRRLGPPREPAALAAAGVLASFVAVSFFLRAIREPRHWIAVLPALLLLNLTLFAWLEERRPRLAPLSLLAILAGFPFTFYRQAPEGFRAVASQLHLPARMLVSSSLGWGEGPWIAVVAAGEKRPQSTIARSTKLLAESDWNLGRYRLLAGRREEIEQILDEGAIDIAVLHQAPGPDAVPHHGLLLAALRGSPSWRRCAGAGQVEAYCRTLPPQSPRKPLRIQLRDRLGYDIEER